MLNQKNSHRKKPISATSRRSHHVSAPPAPAHLAKSVLKGVLSALLTALLSLFLLSAVAYFNEDPLALILPLGIAAAAVTAFVAGFCTVKIHKHSALLCGLSTGCILTALMLVCSLCFRAEASGYSPLITALLHVGFLLLCVIGAFAGLPRTSAKKHRPPSARH